MLVAYSTRAAMQSSTGQAFVKIAGPCSSLFEILGVSQQQLLLHLGALVWRTEFFSRQDMVDRGVWLPTIRLAKARELYAVKCILASASGGDNTSTVANERDLARIICEWLVVYADFPKYYGIYLWLYADWKSILLYTWLENGQPLFTVPLSPHMPTSVDRDGIALYAKWTETAPTEHVMCNQESLLWWRLENKEQEPICQLRRYDNQTWTNVHVLMLQTKSPAVHMHVFSFQEAETLLPMGSFMYQIYPAQAGKRQFQIPEPWFKTHAIHVFRRQNQQWIMCVAVRLDSGTWPYFVLPYDDTHAIAVIFALNETAALQLLDKYDAVGLPMVAQ